MKKIVFLVLLLELTEPAMSFAGYNTFSSPSEQETQLEIKGIQQQLQQAEIDRQIENEARDDAAEAVEEAQQEAEKRVREATDQAEQEVREATEQAEQAAEELRDEMLQSSIRTKNNTYFGVVLLSISGFLIYIISKRNKEKPMNENQKYGVVTMLVSFLLILLALMISEGGIYTQDYLENFMSLLRIQLFETKTERPYVANDIFSGGFDYSYLINLPTKYVVLALLSTATYGLTTYLEISPAFRPWKKIDGK